MEIFKVGQVLGGVGIGGVLEPLQAAPRGCEPLGPHFHMYNYEGLVYDFHHLLHRS